MLLDSIYTKYIYKLTANILKLVKFKELISLLGEDIYR